jgi:hypothetical protein
MSHPESESRRGALLNAVLKRHNNTSRTVDVPKSPSRALYNDHDKGMFDRNEMRKGIQGILRKHGPECLRVGRVLTLTMEVGAN